MKEDTGLAVAAGVLFEDKRERPPTFVMGGIVFEYTKQDWKGHAEALADALTETYLAYIYAPTPEIQAGLVEGYVLLLGSCCPRASRLHDQQLNALGAPPHLAA